MKEYTTMGRGLGFITIEKNDVVVGILKENRSTFFFNL